MIQPRPEIDGMSPYSPGKSLAEARLASGHAQMVKLASNESLWGPSPLALDAVREALAEAHYYPPVQSRELIQRLAETCQVTPEEILIGNGADELLSLAAKTYVSPGDDVVYPVPSFPAYRRSTLLAGGIPIEVPLAAGGANNLEAMLAAITPHTRLVYLCSPNNPTGTAFGASDWEHYLQAVPDHVLTVVDAAYAEFMPRVPDYLGAVRGGKSVMMVRTFSKIYALAGFRVGWAAAPAPITAAVLRVREPFSVNAFGMVAAERALTDRAYTRQVQEETWQSRAFLTRALAERQVPFFDSDSNFVTVRVPDSRATYEQLLQQGFVVRPTESFGLAGAVRVTVAPLAIMQAFVEAWDRLIPSG